MIQLVNDGIFACVNCKELLVDPIMLVEDVGNVCGICYETKFKIDVLNHCLPNKITTIILSKLKLPCKYKIQGCDAILSHNNKRNHESTCKFHTRECPYKNYEKTTCEWNGSLENLVHHMFQSHNQFVIRAQSNSFTLEIDIKAISPNGEYYLILMDSYKFILKFAFASTTNSLRHVLYKVAVDEAVKLYYIKYQGSDENCYLSIKASLQPLENLFNFSNVEKMNLEVLQQMTHFNDKLKLIFTIDDSDVKQKQPNDNIQDFECPVCYEPMRPPIYLCKVGHSICIKCKSEVKQCPNCQAELTNTRNFDLENLLSKKFYHCSYQDNGCMEISIYDKITEHEKSCPCRPYNCPVDGCGTVGTRPVITKHLSEMHSQLVCVGKTEYSNNSLHSTHRQYLLVHDEIFRLTYRLSRGIACFAADIIGSKQPSKKYMYEVTITTNTNSGWQLIKKGFCLGELNDAELNKHCLLIPLIRLTTFGEPSSKTANTSQPSSSSSTSSQPTSSNSRISVANNRIVVARARHVLSEPKFTPCLNVPGQNYPNFVPPPMNMGPAVQTYNNNLFYPVNLSQPVQTANSAPQTMPATPKTSSGGFQELFDYHFKIITVNE